MNALSEKKSAIAEYMDRMSATRERWIKRNQYYYNDLVKFFTYNIPEGSSVIEIGCGTGYLLDRINPLAGVGIDISQGMIEQAKRAYPRFTFHHMDGESITLKEKFDFIIISDTMGYFEDIQKALLELKKISHEGTRIIITYQNFLWIPFYNLAEKIRLKMPSRKINWLNHNDIANLLLLTGFDVVRTGKRFLSPKFIPLLSWVMNRYLVHLPFFNGLAFTGFIIARPFPAAIARETKKSVSVIIPARNEKGNIENAITRMPRMGKHTEIIFVEGHSSDGTIDTIKEMHRKYSKKWDIRYAVQDGAGKGDAVRKGFDMARGDILMILDADLTVPPEDLYKFYDAIASGWGEFINGTRLVYPMEDQAMRLLNMLGNKFFSMMFSWLLKQRIKDTLCGTKVITKHNWERLVANRGFFGDFDPFGDFDLLFGAAKLNLKIVEIPIRYQAREYGDTNISRFRHGWLLIKMVVFAMNKIKFI
ncbi:MAG TPA: glycosyltransferase [Spirochaetota bacterium]|nr:glycosyltransferase [Spirochaetota bacterium]HNT11674.1 glycosyltransferase [Spirochaetota bacterium]